MSEIENPVVLTKQGRIMGKTKVGVQLFLLDSIRCTTCWRASFQGAAAHGLMG